MTRTAGGTTGAAELAAVLALGAAALAVVVIVGPGEQPEAAPQPAPTSDIFSGPDGERGPLDGRVTFSQVPEGWAEDVPSRDFQGLGDRTSTLTTFFTDASGETGEDALPSVFVCLAYANADTCTFGGPDLITTRRVGDGVLMKVTGLSAELAPDESRLSAEQRQVWQDALRVRFGSPARD